MVKANNNNLIKDSRNKILKILNELLDETLRASLIAQLCARGSSLDDAIKKYKKLTKKDLSILIASTGRSGYLEFQWISESIIEAKSNINKINLNDFWEFVRAGRSTKKVYEDHLISALKTINDNTSGIHVNLQNLYKGYPANSVTSDSLPILRRIQEATYKIEHTINKLLNLSPPAKRRVPIVSSRLIIGMFIIAILSIPFFYWLSDYNTIETNITVSSKVVNNIDDVRRISKENPVSLPKYIFTNIIPMSSNVLFAVSALLGLIRAFSSNSQKNTNKMSEELVKAAKLLRELK